VTRLAPATDDELRAVVSHPAARRIEIDFGDGGVPDEAWLVLLE
jgi:hypothetical protein